MNKIEEIINYIRTNTNIPNYGVFIITGLLLDNKKYKDIDSIYDFLTLNLKNFQHMDLIEFDKFLVENNMYVNTYYTKNNNELKKIFDDKKEQNKTDEFIHEDTIELENKIYASKEELNIKYNIDRIINLCCDDKIGWSGCVSNKCYSKSCKENMYYFYLRDKSNNNQKAIVFSY